MRRGSSPAHTLICALNASLSRSKGLLRCNNGKSLGAECDRHPEAAASRLAVDSCLAGFVAAGVMVRPVPFTNACGLDVIFMYANESATPALPWDGSCASCVGWEGRRYMGFDL
eukprot:360834-Chlamydomonas_euryale.AAC.1